MRSFVDSRSSAQRPESAAVISELFLDALARRILVIDGAMGTAIQDRSLTSEDFGGEELAGCNENLVRTCPDVIREIHREYFAAGADCTETNTFGATPLVLAEYGLADAAEELNRLAAVIARETADEFSAADWPRWVLGSMGPTTRTLTVTGGLSFAEMREHYRVQARGLLRGGVDVLVLETVQDTSNLKAGYLGILDAYQDTGIERPIGLSQTIEPMGTMLAGQGVEAFHAAIEHIRPLFVGLNCATGPRFMTDHLRTMSEISPFPVSCYPNAGLPDHDGQYEETPEILSKTLRHFAESGWLNLVGGCCGTTPAHIAAIVATVEGLAPRKFEPKTRSVVSGIDALVIEKGSYPLIVGERTNVIGSRRFKNLIKRGDYERGAEIGRAQGRGGAHILDVCMADPDRDEHEDMVRFLSLVTRMVKLPLMIDSTDATVIEAALELAQGKSIINSINLEDGEERFELVVPLARRYGAALVVGCIDEDPEDGMAITRQRKLAIAERSYELLTQKYGIAPGDIIFDPLVFPVGTGDTKYTASAAETIEGVRAIVDRLPQCHTILGISNVSFGLPPAGREVLNSVFLYHCVQAGLAMAIVNSEKLERYAAIPKEERRLCEDLIYQRSDDPINAFAEHFRGRSTKVAERSPLLDLPIDERLARNVIDGTKEGLIEGLQICLDRGDRPLEVINGPLMAGMAEVGRLFNANELIVAEVLQSAEAMKAAVAFLEPKMERHETASRGKVLLATVKGDVHDIGKNLVQIILSNNGYKVINLGIKVPPAALIEAALEHRPDAIGLSGLLVKSAQQMVVTVEDLSRAGIDVPILVGGAALSERFTANRIAAATDALVVYAKDAMKGLAIANALFSPDSAPAFIEEVRRDQARLVRGGSTMTQTAVATATLPERSPEVPVLESLPPAPDLDLHIEVGIDLEELFSYINPQMLYCRHLGLRGNFLKKRAGGDPKALELERVVKDLLKECIREKLLTPRGMWRFFLVSSTPTEITFHSAERGNEVFDFPRQGRSPYHSICDYVAPSRNGKPVDRAAILVTTCGSGVRERANAWLADGEYLRAHTLQVLALEIAEAFAEWIHAKTRAAWGFPDPADLSRLDLFRARYRGKRYSFGYPACPDLSKQTKLWRLMHPADHIGVELTDGYMMDPEASVSALVFHHPAATYFGVGRED